MLKIYNSRAWTEAARVAMIDTVIEVETKLSIEGVNCTIKEKWALICRTLKYNCNDKALNERSEHAIRVMFAELLRYSKRTAKSCDLRLTPQVRSKLKDYADLSHKLNVGPSSSDIGLVGTTMIEDRQQVAGYLNAREEFEANENIRTRAEPTTSASPVLRGGDAFASRDENDQNLRDIQWVDRKNFEVIMDIFRTEKLRSKEIIEQHFRSVPEGRTVIDRLREAWSNSTLESGSEDSSYKDTSKKASLSGYKTSESKADQKKQDLVISKVRDSYRKRHVKIAEVMKESNEELLELAASSANLLLSTEHE